MIWVLTSLPCDSDEVPGYCKADEADKKQEKKTLAQTSPRQQSERKGDYRDTLSSGSTSDRKLEASSCKSGPNLAHLKSQWLVRVGDSPAQGRRAPSPEFALYFGKETEVRMGQEPSSSAHSPSVYSQRSV